MKKLKVEDENAGLLCLLGEQITVFCLNYFYTGKLDGVNETCIKLSAPKVIYETGSFSDSEWKDAQSLCTESFYIQIGCIEAYGVLK